MYGGKLVVQAVTVYPLSIPLRRRIKHNARTQSISEPIVVAIELQDGTVGYGETLPRQFVTGETNETAIAAIGQSLIPALVSLHAPTFPEALEAIESLPWVDRTGQPILAARAAVEMALLDATLQFYDRSMDDVVRWMGLIGFGSPGSLHSIRYSAVIDTENLDTTRRLLNLYRLANFHDFKINVGDQNDRARLQWTCSRLRRALESGRVSLRVDACCAWTPNEACDWLSKADILPICAIEQPMLPDDDAEMYRLRSCFDGLIVADESLRTQQDAHVLIEHQAADVFNIQLSKCGGMLPSLRLAALARKYNLGIQLGCILGETSILSGAGLSFLSMVPGVKWAEGCFGTRLLSADVVRKSLKFGYAGRIPRRAELKCGADVLPDSLATLAPTRPIVTKL